MSSSQVQSKVLMYRLQAAENEAIMLRTMFASRGCKEHFVPDPKLLSEGKVGYCLTELQNARPTQP